MTMPHKERELPTLDLRQRTYELLSMVREPSAEERKSLTDRGFIFLSIEAKTLTQVFREDPDHFRQDALDYLNGTPNFDVRVYVPQAMDLAVNPEQLCIPDSFYKTRVIQLAMTEKYSQTHLEKELPDAKVLMLPATVNAQADRAYFKKTGQVLFRDYFVRTLDQVGGGSGVVEVGRSLPSHRLTIYRFDVDSGDEVVGALLAVVFIQK